MGTARTSHFPHLLEIRTFIDLDTLVKEGLLTQEEINACYWGENPAQVAYDTVFWYRFPIVEKGVCEKRVPRGTGL